MLLPGSTVVCPLVELIMNITKHIIAENEIIFSDCLKTLLV